MQGQVFPLHRPELVEGVEVLDQSDGQSLLYNPIRGSYIQVSQLGARVVQLLDSSHTVEEIIQQLVALAPQNEARIRAAVTRFVGELYHVGLLIDPEQPVLGGNENRSRWGMRVPAARLVLAEHLELLPQRMAKMVLWAPLRISAGVLGLTLLCAVSLIYLVLRQGLGQVSLTPGFLPLLLLPIVLHVVFHELAHVLACGLVGIRVRQIGVTFYGYLFPMAYVDHTDCYRLTQRRQRAAVPLAGPVFDLIAAGFSAGLVLFSDGTIAGIARTLLFIQLNLFVLNCNPLLPTDGFHVMQALIGERNFRNRAFTYAFRSLLRRPMPPWLISVSAVRRWAYVGYVLCTLVFIGVLVGLMGRSLGGIIIR